MPRNALTARHVPIFQLTPPRRAEMVRLLLASSAGQAAAPDRCSQDGRSGIGGGLSLQSLSQVSLGFTRSTRGGEAMRADTIGVL
jgi:hypothetical protein